jgi:hypothetical protein
MRANWNHCGSISGASKKRLFDKVLLALRKVTERFVAFARAVFCCHHRCLTGIPLLTFQRLS